jgi:hypothetical protein
MTRTASRNISRENISRETLPQVLIERISAALGCEDWQIVENTGQLGAMAKVPTKTYELLIPDKRAPVAANWELQSMPHCCGICVSTNSAVHWTLRKRGLGTVLNSLRIHLAKSLGYSLLLCTDKAGNIAQRRILEHNGWRDIHSFENDFTGNRIYISVLALK